MRIFTNPNYNFIRWRWHAIALSLAVVIAGVATVVVAKWTGDLDTAHMKRVLDGETVAEAEEPEQVLDAQEAHMPAVAR